MGGRSWEASIDYGTGPIPGAHFTYSPDGSLLAFISDTEVATLLDIATLRPKNFLRVPPPPAGIRNLESLQTLVFSPDSKKLAGSGYSGRIVLWDVNTGQVTALVQGPVIPYARPRPGMNESGKPAAVYELAISPDGKSLVSAGKDTVRLWDIAEGRAQFEFEVSGNSWSVAFSPDGKAVAMTVAVGPVLNTEHLIVICDAATGRKQAVLRGHEGTVRAVRYLPDGKTLVSLGDDQTLRLWDPAAGQQRGVLRFGPDSSAYTHLAVAPFGRLLATGGYESDPMFGVIELIETDGTTLRHRQPRR
jgi:WD40 repeat protein